MIGMFEAVMLKDWFKLTDADIAKIDARLPDLMRVVRDLGPIVMKIIAEEENLHR